MGSKLHCNKKIDMSALPIMCLVVDVLPEWDCSDCRQQHAELIVLPCQLPL